MINVSDEFKRVMLERTNFRTSAKIYLADGAEIALESGDFSISGNTITDGAGTRTFPVGVAVSRVIKVTLNNTDERYTDYDFYGAVIDLHLSLQLSLSTESIFIGQFTVTEPVIYGSTVTMTAQDAMWRTGKTYTSSLQYPATLSDLYQECCTQAGVPFESRIFTNSDLAVSAAPVGYTIRDVLGYIAQLAGGNARVSRDGYMQILTYNFDAQAHILDKWIKLDIDTDDITITGLRAVNMDESTAFVGGEGYVLLLENPLIVGMEQAALEAVMPYLVGVTIRKFSGKYIGYPIAEFMDMAEVADRKGRTYRTVLTDISFTVAGATTFACNADSTIRQGTMYVSPANKAVIAARKLVAEERTAREAAIDRLSTSLANASGMYSTDEEQEDGSAIRYLHDKPTIAESTNIIKVTSEAIGFSTNGGDTYPFGLVINGDVIVRILSAEGINADWITTGTLTVTDEEGNILFSADKDRNSLYIAGDTVDLDGRTIDSALSDLEKRAFAEIAQTADSLQTTVAETYYSRTETDDLVLSVETQITQNASAVDIRFAQVSADIEDAKAYTDEGFAGIQKYIRFEDGTATFGEEGNKITLKIENDRIGIYHNGSVVTYWALAEMVAPMTIRIPLGGRVEIGNFGFVPRSSGNLSIMWLG